MDPIAEAAPAESAVPAAGEQVQAPWHESIYEAPGKLANDWVSKLPDEIRKPVSDSMAAARAKTEGMLKIPGEADPPESWDAVWKALGRPDAPEGYGLKKPDAMPDGVEWSDDLAGGFSAVAHRIGMPKGQAEQLIAWHTEQMGAQAKATRDWAAQQVAAEQKALTDAYGVQLADVAGLAQRAAAEAGIDPKLMDPSAPNLPGVDAFRAVASLASKIQALTKESSFGGPAGTTAAKGGWEWANDVMTNRDNPDYAKYYAGEPGLVKRVTEAMKTISRSN